MKPISEYYSNDGYKRSTILAGGSLYKVITFDSHLEKMGELNFSELQDAEDYAEDYVMGVRQ